MKIGEKLKKIEENVKKIGAKCSSLKADFFKLLFEKTPRGGVTRMVLAIIVSYGLFFSQAISFDVFNETSSIKQYNQAVQVFNNLDSATRNALRPLLREVEFDGDDILVRRKPEVNRSIIYVRTWMASSILAAIWLLSFMRKYYGWMSQQEKKQHYRV